MSMLAEPRRKQKWSVDPRNSAWSSNESKFGQKMLERMGWSKGKGLGRTEQGSTEHIRVKVKNNQLGLGTNLSYEDNWIAHQDDFNQLLADLNNCHGQTSVNEAPSENLQEKTFGLEEKSKTSRKRVHYMKFTKGKDLSSRSQTDLACIFGKRTSKTKEKNSQNEDEEMGPATKVMTSETDVDAITKTVTSSLTMQEYFSQRMAQLKKDHAEVPTAASSPESSDTMQQLPADIVNDNPQKRRKRKRKREKDEEADVVVIKEEDEEWDVLEDCQEMKQSVPEKRRKKKKKKKKQAEEKATVLVEEDCSATAGAELNCNDKPTSNKKIKKLKEQSSEKDIVTGHTPAEEESSKTQFVNNKKTENNSAWNEEEELVKEKKSEKDKKKMKRRNKLMV
ncbi:hypothetical protein UPYG_G00247780 [Umbra pygmaea]|uniref:G-patch domain-containing protein n=1 Tax=Umbra pygmaea TaxID=75934 RepID=A0ABD0W6Z0_UMBPY